VEDYKQKNQRGEVIIRECLDLLTDSQLTGIVRILGKKSVVSSEEKIVEVAYVLLSDLNSLDLMIAAANRSKYDILSVFTAIYVRESSMEKSTGLSFTNEK
ncbi:unnamed protein product, partial [Effrenium voratum]